MARRRFAFRAPDRCTRTTQPPFTSTVSSMPTCPFCNKAVPDESSVCPHCLRAQPAAQASSARSSRGSRVSVGGHGRMLLLLAVLAAAGAYAFRQYRGSSLPSFGADPEPVEAPPQPAPAVAQTTIAPPLDVRVGDTSTVSVRAGSYVAFPFTGEDRSTCRLRGSVRSLSGGAIDVFVVDGMGADDLANGRPPRKYYEATGSSAVTLDASLDGRSHYSLVIASPAGSTRARTVKLDATAACTD